MRGSGERRVVDVQNFFSFDLTNFDTMMVRILLCDDVGQFFLIYRPPPLTIALARLKFYAHIDELVNFESYF